MSVISTALRKFRNENYSLARFAFQRGVAFVYLIAFAVVLKQFRPLLGERGLLPAPRFLNFVRFDQAPSIFHFYYSDGFLIFVGWVGIILSLAALIGFTERLPWWGSTVVWAMLWILYLSIVNVGQQFYSFGWESMLLEAGFLAIFLGNNKIAMPLILIFFIRWMLFRIEFGSGLIKLRADECWRNLTCLTYHYETQPMPNPLSWFFHHLPPWMHKIEAIANYSFQLIVPFGLFLPQPVAAIAGGLIIVSQTWLILSGNFVWLNWLTIILALSTFANSQLRKILPLKISKPQQSSVHQGVSIALATILVVLSWWPLKNFFSSHQLMNASYNPFHIVNSYGAFGTVTKERFEIIIEGTNETTITPETQWKEYEFKGKPGNVNYMPHQFAPYHLRLDWLMWFHAFNPPGRYEEWFIRFIEKILQGDKQTLSLIRYNPFPDKPPKFIRARYYLYEFTDLKELKNGAWWKRKFVSEYLPPVSLKDI